MGIYLQLKPSIFTTLTICFSAETIKAKATHHPFPSIEGMSYLCPFRVPYRSPVRQRDGNQAGAGETLRLLHAAGYSSRGGCLRDALHLDVLSRLLFRVHGCVHRGIRKHIPEQHLRADVHDPLRDNWSAIERHYVCQSGRDLWRNSKWNKSGQLLITCGVLISIRTFSLISSTAATRTTRCRSTRTMWPFE